MSDARSWAGDGAAGLVTTALGGRWIWAISRFFLLSGFVAMAFSPRAPRPGR
jgi:hypothetical protein